MNKVYLLGSCVSLVPYELAREANANIKSRPFTALDYAGLHSRIAGNLCDCNGDGEFELLPADDPDVLGGGKRYMQCRKCGCWSHL